MTSTFGPMEKVNNIPLSRAVFDENGFEHPRLLEFQLREHDVTLTRVEPFQNVYKFKDVYHWDLRIGDSYTKTISYVHELQQAFNDCGIELEIIV